MSRITGITAEQWEIQKLINKVGHRWTRYNNLGLLAIALFILTLFDLVGISWITGPRHPHVGYWLLMTADVLFWIIGVLLMIGFLITEITSMICRKQSRTALEQLLAVVRRIVVVDVKGQPNRCTVVHLHNGRPFVLRWVSKHCLLTAIEDYSIDTSRQIYKQIWLPRQTTNPGP